MNEYGANPRSQQHSLRARPRRPRPVNNSCNASPVRNVQFLISRELLSGNIPSTRAAPENCLVVDEAAPRAKFARQFPYNSARQKLRMKAGSEAGNYGTNGPHPSGEATLSKLSQELAEMHKKRLPYCAYINSFEINREMENSAKRLKSKQMIQADALNTLVSMHLRRLNVKIKDPKDAEVASIGEIARYGNYTSIMSIEELKEQSRTLIRSVDLSTKPKESGGESIADDERRKRKRLRSIGLFLRRQRQSRDALEQKFAIVQHRDRDHKKSGASPVPANKSIDFAQHLISRLAGLPREELHHPALS